MSAAKFFPKGGGTRTTWTENANYFSVCRRHKRFFISFDVLKSCMWSHRFHFHCPFALLAGVHRFVAINFGYDFMRDYFIFHNISFNQSTNKTDGTSFCTSTDLLQAFPFRFYQPYRVVGTKLSLQTISWTVSRKMPCNIMQKKNWLNSCLPKNLFRIGCSMVTCKRRHTVHACLCHLYRASIRMSA